jgi:hypothetical protein
MLCNVGRKKQPVAGKNIFWVGAKFVQHKSIRGNIEKLFYKFHLEIIILFQIFC